LYVSFIDSLSHFLAIPEWLAGKGLLLAVGMKSERDYYHTSGRKGKQGGVAGKKSDPKLIFLLPLM
jgi:hypothetical protein